MKGAAHIAPSIPYIDLKIDRSWRFESSQQEGAIIILPNGLTSAHLGPLTSQLRNYLADYHRAVAFYAFLREKRGQDVQNGDLRVVHSFHSCSKWGMATFKKTNVDEPAIPATVKLRFILRNGDGQRYHDGWEYDSPGGRFVINARVSRQTELGDTESRGQSSPADGVSYENQCLFLKTFCIRFRDDIWATFLEQNDSKLARGLPVQGTSTPSPEAPTSPDPNITTSKTSFFASGVQPSSGNACHLAPSVSITL